MECPTCGKHLDTEQGVRIHHTRVHDERLPNRTCKGCSTEFYDPKAQRVFCDDCNPNAGEHNGNWKGAKETTQCKRCDEEFEYYPSDKKGVYCSDCVSSATSFLGTPSYERKDSSPVMRRCEQCDGLFSVYPYVVRNGEGRFCSRGCHSEWMSENWRGENHHQWIDGDVTYSGKWWAVRRLALDRDNHQCRHCGVTKDEIGQEPDVHHLTPIREFDNPQNAHTLENVISLCRSCHRRAEVESISVDTEK
ncbi:HNH endonuclease [Natronomonas sp. EA1]|uniref:HNH endonuclease n=1 Tax=Natronomonas sp. EA1 TaxID=3421655 RepID=UPI003EC0B417